MLVRDNFSGSNLRIDRIRDKRQRKSVLLHEIQARAKSLENDESIANLTDLYELVKQYAEECSVAIKKEARIARKNSGGYEKCNILKEYN